MDMKKQKIIGLALGILFFIVMIAGISYAYSVWQSASINTKVSSKCFNVLYIGGQDINVGDGKFMPSDDYTGGLSAHLRMDFSSVCPYVATGKIFLETLNTTSSNLYDGLLKYQVLKGNTPVANGVISGPGTIEIDVGVLNRKSFATTRYSVYVWLDNNLITNEDAGSLYYGKVKAEAYQVVGEVPEDGVQTSVNLINHITDLYSAYYDSSYNTTFGDSTGMNYYAPSVRLMNDGLDSTGNMTNDPYTGNIRYYGADDSDLKNYIYFNCSDYSNPSDTTCEKWRIVGIVDGKVKIMRGARLGAYSWDYTSSGEYNNEWRNATLNTLLNQTYYNSGTTTYYNNSSIGVTVDFTSNGITAATRNNNLISTTDWYTNQLFRYQIYPNEAYTTERTGTSSWNGNIAMVYPSDYGYAVDINSCQYNMYNYKNCVSNNWMYGILSDFSNKLSWLFTSRSHETNPQVYRIKETGDVAFANSNVSQGVTPALYLNPELVISLLEGDGSSSNPYRLVVE